MVASGDSNDATTRTRTVPEGGEACRTMTIEYETGPLEDCLASVEDEPRRMAGLARCQMRDVVRLLARRDDDLAFEFIERDYQVDAHEREIDDGVHRVLALRQPVAGDLERIGDHLRNIARRSTRIRRRHMPTATEGVLALARHVDAMLESTLNALADWSADAALTIFSQDFCLDLQYGSPPDELVQRLAHERGNPAGCVQLLLIAKSLERIGDHATNIAEDVIYAVQGERPPERAVIRTD